MNFDSAKGADIEVALRLDDRVFADGGDLPHHVDLRGEAERAEDDGLELHLQRGTLGPQRPQGRLFPPGIEVGRLAGEIAAGPVLAGAGSDCLRSRRRRRRRAVRGLDKGDSRVFADTKTGTAARSDRAGARSAPAPNAIRSGSPAARTTTQRSNGDEHFMLHGECVLKSVLTAAM